MARKEPDLKKIYVLKEVYRKPDMEEAYCYIRTVKGNKEVAFSVLDEKTSFPDFSNCGVFWLRIEDFTKMFRAV